MNKKVKIIGAALLAATICASFAGCSKKDDTGVYADKNGNISVNESKLENHVNSVFGGETGKSDPSSAESEQEKYKFAVSDEIKKAAFNTGTVQLNNDIFQFDGKMTVAEFVEKYKDKYEIGYKGGKYEERKDYLLEYQNYNDASTSYYLEIKSKESGKTTYIAIDNATSPDEKITLDKAVVMGLYSHDDAVVYPGGFLSETLVNELRKEEGFVNPNESCTVKSLPEFFESQGFKKAELSTTALQPKITSADQKFYWQHAINEDLWGCICCGDVGLNGKIPVYKYEYLFDGNTDKLAYAGFEYYYMDPNASDE